MWVKDSFYHCCSEAEEENLFSVPQCYRECGGGEVVSTSALLPKASLSADATFRIKGAHRTSGRQLGFAYLIFVGRDFRMADC